MKLYEGILQDKKNGLYSFYKEFEKAETLMKMFSLDPEFEVSRSYDRTFQLRKDLEVQVDEKEKRIKELEKRNY